MCNGKVVSHMVQGPSLCGGRVMSHTVPGLGLSVKRTAAT